MIKKSIALLLMILSVSVVQPMSLNDSSNEITLEIDPSKLTAKGGYVYFDPDHGKNQGSFNIYLFDEKEFVSKIGDYENLSGPVQVTVRVQSRKTEEREADPYTEPDFDKITIVNHLVTISQ